MSEYDPMEREMGWDDEVQNVGSYPVLPEGDYEFRVERFERARHGGSEKIPPCNKAVLTLDVVNDAASGTVQTNLFLYHKQQWKLFQFFTSIGQQANADGSIRMNWSKVPGATGQCKVGIRKWTGNDGKERESNEIVEFYAPTTPSGQFQEVRDDSIPAQWNQAPTPGGYTPGKW